MHLRSGGRGLLRHPGRDELHAALVGDRLLPLRPHHPRQRAADLGGGAGARHAAHLLPHAEVRPGDADRAGAGHHADNHRGDYRQIAEVRPGFIISDS